MNDKDFLQGYEIKNWEYSPRIYKVIAVAVVFNLLSLFGLSQTNLLSASACESPFVNRVCQVLDTVYVGTKLFSGEKDYVVKDYNQTQIDDADVVWVDSTNVQPQLNYPTGYFEVANRDEIAARNALLNPENTFDNPTTLPPFTPAPNPTPAPKVNTPYRRKSNSGGGLLGRKQKVPNKIKDPVKGEIDDDLVQFEDDTKDNKDNNATADKDGKKPPKKNPIADKVDNKSNSVADIEINKKPLQDFADTIVVKWAKKEVDLNNQFVVRMRGSLTADGKLDRNKSRFDTSVEQGDKEMIKVAKAAIEAVGDSGWLGYLRNLGAKEITITLMQNEQNLVVRVESETKSESEAKTLASGANTLISTTKQFVKLGEDETKLINAAKTPTYQGKVFILDFQMTKPEAQEMMNRKLTEAWAKKQKEQNGNQTQPNGTTKKSDANDKSVK